MKIASWNVNGIRSVQKNGFSDWLIKSDIDILCIQETKAQPDQLTWDITNIPGYELFMNSAEKKGYSGTAIYTKVTPDSVINKFGMKRFDSEGRMVRLDFFDFILINLYIPNGGRNKENMEYKLDFYQKLFKYIKKIDKKVILCGDFNIAHKEIDLARPKENMNNTMFTPEERVQIDKLLDLGFIDTFRLRHEDEPGFYSWWAYYRNLRERNIGWRIDYFFISKDMIGNLKDAFILKGVTGSDHCPVGIEVSI